MAQNKTTYTNVNVDEFLSTLDNQGKLNDSLQLIKLMSQVTKEESKMWGPSIIGFGAYSYTYASGHSGVAPIIGFSPRKAAISLYVYSSAPSQDEMLKSLGKFTMGKACIYIKKLSDINLNVLNDLMKSTLFFVSTQHKRIPPNSST